jgi:hypothetical protein
MCVKAHLGSDSENTLGGKKEGHLIRRAKTDHVMQSSILKIAD